MTKEDEEKFYGTIPSSCCNLRPTLRVNPHNNKSGRYIFFWCKICGSYSGFCLDEIEALFEWENNRKNVKEIKL